MDTVVESSTTDQKPVIVRVKRKSDQSLLDGFWLEINETPLNRLKKVLVRHLETVTESDIITDSFFESDHSFCRKRKFEEDRKFDFKEEKTAENVRFEQIRRSKKGNKRIHEHNCRFYDVIRVDDAEEKPDNNEAEITTSLKDQKKLSCYLPLLREFVPTAAEEIEANHINSCHTEEEYVYDYYASVNEEMDHIISSKNQFPLVKVEDGEEDGLCGEPDESEYDSDDSNAEYYVMNDEDKETSKRHVRRVSGDDEFDDGYAENENGSRESDEEFEYCGLNKGEVCVPNGDTFVLF